MTLWFASLFTTPWWVFVPLGIVVATFSFGAYFVIAGGVLLDVLYGVPVLGLSFPVLYTILFGTIALVRIYIEERLLV